MKMRVLLLSSLLAASVAMAADLERAAAITIIGMPDSPATWLWVSTAGDCRSAIERYDGGPVPSMADVRATTNSPAVLSLAAQLDAAALAPPEVDRIAYVSGWSSTITNGVEIYWRTHLSPYDPAGDVARRDAAIAAQAQAAARYEASAAATRAAQAALVANPNSMPAMRALLAALVEQVEALKGAQ